jgi:FeS assembly SUF system regulator
MIRISKMADYAVVILVTMARQQQADGKRALSASQIAALSHLPEPTVSKILKILSRDGILISLRGMNGGYLLHLEPQAISVDRIVGAIDGPVAITSCANDAKPDCGLSHSCSMRGRWDGVNTAIRDALRSVTLSDMAWNNAGTHYLEKEAACGRH